MDLFSGLIGDATPLLAPSPAPEDAVLRRQCDSLGPLLAADHGLAELDRRLPEDRDVVVWNSTGAGGLTAVAGRAFDRLRPVGVISPLRDPGDLAANALRVATAARGLDPDITVYVGFPAAGSVPGSAPPVGWTAALEVAEGEGLSGFLDLGLGPAEVAALLSAYVEADLPFRAGVLSPGSGPYGLIRSVDAVIDGAAGSEIVDLLGGDDQQGTAIAGWNDTRVGRVRRRLQGIDCADPTAVLARIC